MSAWFLQVVADSASEAWTGQPLSDEVQSSADKRES